MSQLPASTDRVKIITTAQEIMSSVKNAAFITINKQGFPNSRAMDPFPPDSTFTVWLATNPRSGKVSEIRLNNKVSLYYFDAARPGYVMIQGVAELINDHQSKDKYWKEGWKNFYKDRGANYLLIKVSPIRLEVVDYKNQLLGDTLTWKAPGLEFGRLKSKK